MLYYTFLEHFRVVLYTCCRDGMARDNECPRKTKKCRKKRPTRKLDKDGFCIARMTATENLKTGMVTVNYISSHSCHKPSIDECKYLPLPASLRQKVLEKCAAGITIEKIMDGELTVLRVMQCCYSIVFLCVCVHASVCVCYSWVGYFPS